MEPLRVFIAKVRTWHVVATVVFALMFVIVTYLIDDQANASADSILLALFSLVAIPAMIFTLAFFAFVSSTNKFAAPALFPSIFIVCSAFVALGMVNFAMQEADAPIILLLCMGMIASLMMSGMMCAMIAIQQRRRR